MSKKSILRHMAAPLSICTIPFASHKQQALSCQDSSLQNWPPAEQNSLTSLDLPVKVATHLDSLLNPTMVDAETLADKQDRDSFLTVRVSDTILQKARALASTRFKEGNYWVWLYRDPSGKPYSWERYQVCATGNDAEVAIEMSSRFAEDEKYMTHHRMKLSLGECLASRVYHKTWRFHQFAYKSSGEWCEAPFQDNVQAFEEKFDVFLMDDAVPADRIENSRLQNVVGLGDFGPSALVQTQRHGYTKSWYASHPRRHAGLAAFKEFVGEHQENGSHYTFELVEVGHGADVSGAFAE